MAPRPYKQCSQQHPRRKQFDFFCVLLSLLTKLLLPPCCCCCCCCCCTLLLQVVPRCPPGLTSSAPCIATHSRWQRQRCGKLATVGLYTMLPTVIAKTTSYRYFTALLHSTVLYFSVLQPKHCHPQQRMAAAAIWQACNGEQLIRCSWFSITKKIKIK